MIWSWPLLMVLLLVLPLLGWASWRQSLKPTSQAAVLPSPSAMMGQIWVLQSVVALLGLLAWLGTNFTLSWGSHFGLNAWLLAALAVGVFLLLAWWEASRPVPADQQWRLALRKITAKNPWWVGTTLYAGLVEEFVYRGLLTGLLMIHLEWWAAALISAMAFGLAHLSGGRRAAASGVLFALSMQGLVWFSGGLAMAMMAHVVYDLMAAWLGHRQSQRA
ncbi:CPBP family intramembrane glutamic endopeptidase [Marinicella meishanensis]|uniref:CPBP family intramembrane glutamic endopeptidase n=1 Tax=Marinicella meishanensis TaxID=2873263 RepID=UPI001CC0B7CF|nr:CPBP family intramembrane glutamic endopeptidase [Marinicella sp. NBU2979]